jgi:hypothetical protein
VLKTTENITETRKEQVCCTWQKDADCDNCPNKEVLDCRWEQKLLIRFMLALLPSLLIILTALIVGGIIVGAWWWIGVVAGYYALFFIIETRILCSHCPYYSEEGKILHCLANHGFIKWYRYHPGPMSRLEKILLIIGFILFATVPLGAEIYYILMITLNLGLYNYTQLTVLVVITGLTLLAISFSFSFLFTRICPQCVNFSCPFNKAQKEYIDEYLRRNPVMKEAWEKCGYKTNN